MQPSLFILHGVHFTLYFFLGPFGPYVPSAYPSAVRSPIMTFIGGQINHICLHSGVVY